MAKKSKAVIDEVIKGVMNGKTIKKVLSGLDDPISFQSWSNWLAKDQALLNRYHQAKISALDYQLAEIKDELDKCVADSVDPKAVSMSRVNLLKIKSANIQWELSKLMPKNYGTSQQIQVSNAKDESFRISWKD